MPVRFRPRAPQIRPVASTSFRPFSFSVWEVALTSAQTCAEVCRNPGVRGGTFGGAFPETGGTCTRPGGGQRPQFGGYFQRSKQPARTEPKPQGDTPPYRNLRAQKNEEPVGFRHVHSRLSRPPYPLASSRPALWDGRAAGQQPPSPPAAHSMHIYGIHRRVSPTAFGPSFLRPSCF